MAVTSTNYNLKTDAVEVVKFAGDTQALQEIRDWVEDALTPLPEYSVSLNSMMGVSLSFSYPFAGGTRSCLAYVGDYIIKDSDGFVYKVSEEQLNLLYKQA